MLSPFTELALNLQPAARVAHSTVPGCGPAVVVEPIVGRAGVRDHFPYISLLAGHWPREGQPWSAAASPSDGGRTAGSRKRWPPSAC
jgi:hypothetical protein